MAKRSKWTRWAPAAAIPVLVFALAWVMGAWDKDALIPIDEVHPIDGERLLVLGISGQDSDTRRWSRIAVLERDGVLRNEIQQKGELRLIGVAEDLVWLDHPEHSIHARTLPDLELVSGIGEAVQNHPALSHKHQHVGFTADAAIVKGPDFKDYRVGKDGSIERAPDDLEFIPKGRSMFAESVPRLPAAEYRALSELAEGNELTQTVIVLGATQERPDILKNPDSVLVTSLEFVKGGRSHTLSRMTTEGELLWTTTAEALMDAVELEGQAMLFEWIGLLGGELWAVVELTESQRNHEGDHWAEHMQRLVRIDPQTGEILDSRLVTKAADSD